MAELTHEKGTYGEILYYAVFNYINYYSMDFRLCIKVPSYTSSICSYQK